MYPEVTLETALSHGLSELEYNDIILKLGRNPNYVELKIFSLMWNEKYSNKSSIKLLNTLPSSGGRLLMDTFNNRSTLIDIGHRHAIEFTMNSYSKLSSMYSSCSFLDIEIDNIDSHSSIPHNSPVYLLGSSSPTTNHNEEILLNKVILNLSSEKWMFESFNLNEFGIVSTLVDKAIKNKCGFIINIDKLIHTNKQLNTYEFLLSETLGGKIVTIKHNSELELTLLLKKWNIPYQKIGLTSDSHKIDIFENNSLIAQISPPDLKSGYGAPQYDYHTKEPTYISQINDLDISSIEIPLNFNKTLIELLSSDNISGNISALNLQNSSGKANKINEKYESSSISHLKHTNQAISMSISRNDKYLYLNPRLCGKILIAKLARLIVSSGGEPMAFSNYLRFGNPNNPEHYWQFKEVVLGLGEMSRAINTPVVNSNVNFKLLDEDNGNQSELMSIIGMVGLLENHIQSTTLDFKDEGDFIISIGSLNGVLGGSEYLETIHDKVQGPICPLDIETEMRVQDVCIDAIKAGIIKSAHDLSIGGLTVNIAESIMKSGNSYLGAKLNLSRKLRNDELLFGECQSVIIVTISEEHLIDIVTIAKKHDIPTQTIGRVTSDATLTINDLIKLDRISMEKVYFKSKTSKES
jgi:phosphoribosylformylglycinamidine synthase subunit PurL